MARVQCSAILALLTLSLSTCLPFVGDGGVRVDGIVLDSMGRPVPDAIVFFDTPARRDYPSLFEIRTRPDGRFQLSPTVAPGRYDIPLVVEASGYRDATLPVPTLKRNTFEVRLERADSITPSRINLVASE